MKDLEIQEQAEKWCQENIDKHGFCDNVELAFIAGAKWMQEQDKWISVDTPPKEGGRYLSVVKELNDLGYCTYVWNCCYHEVGNRWSDNLKDMIVTHWQILPSLPKTK